MQSRVQCALTVAVVVMSSFQSVARAGYAEVILDSTPGSYIGGGKNYDIIDTKASAVVVYPSANLPDGELTNIEISVFQSGTVFAATSFSTQKLGIPLRVGQYNNAVRFPFENPGQPGLDVTFFDEGSNMLTGSFTITSATFFKDAMGNFQVQSFAATFDQVSDNNTSHVTGSVTYTASVPEPSSALLCSIALATGFGIDRLRRRLCRA